MRGREYADALDAIGRVAVSKQYRPETAYKAVGAVLQYLGATRLSAAMSGDPDGAWDRRLLDLLAQVEAGALRLSAIPQRTERAAQRGDAWADISGQLAHVQSLLEHEAQTRDISERLGEDDDAAGEGRQSLTA